MGFNCLKATEPLRGDSLLVTIQFKGGSGTQLIGVFYYYFIQLWNLYFYLSLPTFL